MSFIARFLEWLLGPLVFLSLVAAGFSLVLVGNTADGPWDTELEDSAFAASETLEVVESDGKRAIALPPGAEQVLRRDRHDQVWYVIRRESGEYVAGDADVPPMGEPFGDVDVLRRKGIIDGEAVRIVGVRVPDPRVAGDSLVIEVAETLNKRRALSDVMRWQVLFPQLLVLVAAFALTWYGLAYVMAPMERLKRAIDVREPQDLSPIPLETVPAELAPLIVSVNGLLGRVADGLDAQERFIADASHQLRTPLAGLRSQVERAMAGRDASSRERALERVLGGTDRMIHLVNRLLSLARAESVHLRPRGVVDLAAVAREAMEPFLALAAERRVDLAFESSGETKVRGDAVLLRELVANLVDNAIRYCPSAGKVVVGIAGRVLYVMDTGPGVPAVEAERLFKPFQRGGNAAGNGSGLGLAIVRTIANLHGAEALLAKTALGARFEVHFPAM